ncbi:hypothetical protein VTN96DRAFT_2631 [Rasamsonia emersonii]
MPDPPRRILEKSRTVRRRYQRSNKRFQFTASQIERIEREEERERRAQKLREREKKRIANKKKKAEKEAREREERRRLGLPDPNVKVPASQPRLLNFLERKKEQQQQQLTELSEKESSQQDTEVETEAEDWFDEDQSQSDAQAGSGTSRDSNEKVSAVTAHGQDSHRAMPPTMMVTDCDGNVNEHSPPDPVLDLGESFRDETAILLEDLDPDTLQLSGQTQNEHPETDVSCAQSQSEASLTSRSTCEPISQPDSTCPSAKGDSSKIPPDMASPSHNKMSPAECDGPEPFVIYQDPDDVIAQISTQDLLEVDDGKDDYKENWHPNIPYGPQQRRQPNDVTPRRRPKPYSELQTRAERQPLMTLSQAPDTLMDETSKKKSPLTTRSRRGSSPTPIGRKKQVAGNAGMPASTASPTKDCLVANEDDDEDEFGEFDLTMEELEALCA